MVNPSEVKSFAHKIIAGSNGMQDILETQARVQAQNAAKLERLLILLMGNQPQESVQAIGQNADKASRRPTVAETLEMSALHLGATTLMLDVFENTLGSFRREEQVSAQMKGQEMGMGAVNTGDYR